MFHEIHNYSILCHITVKLYIALLVLSSSRNVLHFLAISLTDCPMKTVFCVAFGKIAQSEKNNLKQHLHRYRKALMITVHMIKNYLKNRCIDKTLVIAITQMICMFGIAIYNARTILNTPRC